MLVQLDEKRSVNTLQIVSVKVTDEVKVDIDELEEEKTGKKLLCIQTTKNNITLTFDTKDQARKAQEHINYASQLADMVTGEASNFELKEEEEYETLKERAIGGDDEQS